MGTVAPKYERLAAELAGLIEAGVLLPGQKLDSVRKVSAARKLAINTVVRAYERLEERGLVVTKPQSGFYVRGTSDAWGLTQRRTALSVPADARSHELVSLVMRSARDPRMVPLGAACLDPALYPLASLQRLTRQVLRESGEILGLYALPPGDELYRQRVAQRLARVGCRVAPDELLATNGALEAVTLALRVTCGPRDTVVVESPLYFGIMQSMEALGLRVVEVASHPERGASLEAIATALSRYRVRAVVVAPNFSNPVGAQMSDADKQALVALAERYDVPVIESDVYAELPFSGDRPRPLKAFDTSGLVLTCSSFSKTVSPALRLGWIAPGRYVERVQALQTSTTLAAGTLSQQVMARYLGSKDYDRHLHVLRLFCAVQTQRIGESILAHFPEGTRISRPRGGFVLWVALPRQVDSVALYRAALAKQITFSPGVLFSVQGRYRNYLRISCGTVWTSRLQAALATLGRLAKQEMVTSRARASQRERST